MPGAETSSSSASSAPVAVFCGVSHVWTPRSSPGKGKGKARAQKEEHHAVELPSEGKGPEAQEPKRKSWAKKLSRLNGARII